MAKPSLTRTIDRQILASGEPMRIALTLSAWLSRSQETVEEPAIKAALSSAADQIATDVFGAAEHHEPERCDTCKYWRVGPLAHYGLCRRHAPTWPQTKPGDWCGEYQRAPHQEEAREQRGCPEGQSGHVGPPGDNAGNVLSAEIDGRTKYLDRSGQFCEICGTVERSEYYRCDHHLLSTRPSIRTWDPNREEA